MDLLDMKILEETVEAVENTDKENITTPTEDNKIITPNVTIEDQTQIPETKSVISNITSSDIEKLEDKINTDSDFIDECITESFYNLSDNLLEMVTLSETINADLIHKQYKLLIECAYNSDEYNDKITALVEASGQNLIQKLVEAIKNFIEWCKDALSKLGVQISIHLVDYEKWASAKENDLVEKASKVGNNITYTIHKWNTDDLFEPIPVNKVEAIADDYISITSDKDTMKEYIEEFINKYKNVSEVSDDVYTHALAVAAGGNPDDRKFTDKEMAKEAYMVKLMGKEKDIVLDAKLIASYVTKLKKIKTDTSRCISSMRSDAINNKFTQLIKDAKSEMNARENKPDSTKYQYFNIRFHVLTAIQNAINDAYKIKCSLMTKYAKELYNACKTLDTYKVESNNESIDFESSTNYIGGTLHA